MRSLALRRESGRLLPALFVCLSGCAGIPESVRQLPQSYVDRELSDVPFHPQERYQCGPAALTTILEASGATVTLDDIVRKVYVPGRQGSFQVELVAATRTSGRLPYLVDKTLAGLVAELQAGRPVIVLQNLGIAAIPRWHYAVVIGVDSKRERVILRSGTVRRRETPIDVFLRTWSRSNFWALVAVRPGEMPANVDRQRYFAAASGLEQANRPAEAALAWEAALRTWPGNTTALFGLGNTHLALGAPDRAEQFYRQLIDTDPAFTVARNNLAMALARQRRFAEAIHEIEQALRINDDAELAGIFRDTRAEVLSMIE